MHVSRRCERHGITALECPIWTWRLAGSQPTNSSPRPALPVSLMISNTLSDYDK